MKTSKPPVIAAWLLDRFGADPQLDAIAGDLLEQYQLGRSRFWYWREVITAITLGTWTAFRDHKLAVLRALVIGHALAYASGWILIPLPLAPLLKNQYAFIKVGVVLLIVGPLAAFLGWIVAQCSRQCRIPAVLGFSMSFLLWGVIGLIQLWILFGANLALWLSMLCQAAMTILILFGSGLLTGSPKRSMSAQPGIPLDESSES
jgi:hypothetical protein